jgi:hypothetical protein
MSQVLESDPAAVILGGLGFDAEMKYAPSIGASDWYGVDVSQVPLSAGHTVETAFPRHKR